MKNRTQCLRHAALTVTLCVPLFANAAGISEQILANPRVQALMGKPAEIVNSLNLCSNATYAGSNQQACAEAKNADSVMKLPVEMRTLMSNPRSAQALRDLCLTQSQAIQSQNYLCAEIIKGDSMFTMQQTVNQLIPAMSNER